MTRRSRGVAWLVLIGATCVAVACAGDTETKKRARLASGDRYAKEGRTADAILEYKSAIQIDPRFGEARLKLAELLEKAGNTQEAVGEYIRAADLMPERADVQLRAAEYLLRGSRFEDAKRIANGLLDKNPSDVSARVILANATAGLQDVSTAISEMESAIKLDPGKLDSYLTLSHFQAASGKSSEAVKILQEALAKNPSSVDVRLSLASLKWANGDLAGTEALFKEALALEPTHLMANRGISIFYLKAGRVKEAEGPIKVVADTMKTVPTRMALAQYYFQAGRPQEAIPLLEALSKEPDGRTPATLMLVRWENANKQQSRAHARLDELLAREPANADALTLKAIILAADGRADEAITRAQAAVAAEPASASAHHAVGLIELQRRNRADALKAFLEALKVAPSFAQSAHQIAMIHLESGEVTLALQFAEDAVRLTPQDPDARLTLARALLLAQKHDRAAALAKQLVSESPSSAEVQILAATVAAGEGRIADARNAFSRALTLEPKSTPALAGLIGLDVAAGRVADARARLSAALAKRPADPALLDLAARTQLVLKDTKSAELLLRKLLEVQPNTLTAYGALGHLYLSQGRLDDARKELEQYTARQPNDVPANTLIGVVLQMQGRLDEAQKRFERVLELDSRSAVAANNLAWMLAEKNTNLDEALQLAQTAKSQLPNQPEVDDTLGYVYLQKGLPGLASSSFRQSVAKDPNNPLYHYHLGLALVKNNEPARGKEALEKALSLKKDFPGVADARRVLAGL